MRRERERYMAGESPGPPATMDKGQIRCPLFPFPFYNLHEGAGMLLGAPHPSVFNQELAAPRFFAQ